MSVPFTYGQKLEFSSCVIKTGFPRQGHILCSIIFNANCIIFYVNDVGVMPHTYFCMENFPLLPPFFASSMKLFVKCFSDKCKSNFACFYTHYSYNLYNAIFDCYDICCIH